MTGLPGGRPMEMNSGNTAPHLTRTLCVPMLLFFFYIGLEAKGLLDLRWNLRPVIFGVDCSAV